MAIVGFTLATKGGKVKTLPEVEALEALGAVKVFTGDDRPEDVFGNTGPRTGDVLILLSHHDIGATADEREERLAKLAALGVAVQVAQGAPVVYDTPALLAEYRAAGIAAQRAAAARKRAKGGKVGRPTKWPATEAQKAAFCPLWWDKNNTLATVKTAAESVMGHPVKTYMLKNWCGLTRTKPKREK